MTFVKRNDSRVTVTQIPFLLLFVAALFTVPMLGFSFFHIFGGTDADGKYFTLVFGLFLLWLLLEFVATREKIEIDLKLKKMMRTVHGVFRHRKTRIDLANVKVIVLEIRRDVRGRKRQHLCLYAHDQIFLVNSPEKVYINHGKIGKLLSELTGIPYRGRVEVV